MKRALFLSLIAVAGAGVGGGAAVGVRWWGGGSTAVAAVAPEPQPEDTTFVPTGPILAPLVLADGGLAGYVAVEVQLEVSAGRAEELRGRLPLLLHAINMRTYRTPLAAGPDGLLPDVSLFRQVVMEAAAEAFGKGAVKRAAITGARPA